MFLAAEVPRRLLERDPFQCSVECGWSGSFYRLDHYKPVVGRARAMYIGRAMNIINRRVRCHVRHTVLLLIMRMMNEPFAWVLPPRNGWEKSKVSGRRELVRSLRCEEMFVLAFVCV